MLRRFGIGPVSSETELVLDDGTRVRLRPAESADECLICYCAIDAGGRVASLPCGHEFNSECAETWLNTTHACPYCRKGLEA